MADETNDNESGAPAWRAELDEYSGPLDLLLYLIKRDEVDIFDIPVARVTEQFLEIVRAMQVLDMNMAGDFLVMAAQLTEIKSRMLLPTEPVEGEETAEEDDPRNDLIRQLLQYKRFKEAAHKLADMAEEHGRRVPRPPQQIDVEPEPVDAFKLLEDVQVWDLFAAFSTLIRQTELDLTESIVYDDVPLAAYVAEVRGRLRGEPGPLAFTALFRRGDDRARLIGIFLALLELAREGEIRVSQLGSQFGDIAVQAVPPEEIPPTEEAPEPEPPPEPPAQPPETSPEAPPTSNPA
jgi:segregation and condensation protein A